MMLRRSLAVRFVYYTKINDHKKLRRPQRLMWIQEIYSVQTFKKRSHVLEKMFQNLNSR